jgi:hypothetical protein
MNAVDEFGGGKNLVHVPVIAVAHVHKFDEAKDMAGVVEMLGEVNNEVIVYAFLDNGVDFEWITARFFSSSNAFNYAFGTVVAATHIIKGIIVDGIEAHGESVQACIFECLCFVGKEIAIGGESEVFYFLDLGQFCNEGFEVATEEGFASGDADFGGPEFCEDFRQAGNFFKGEDVGFGQKLVFFAKDFGGHAIGAPEIAFVGDGDAQVANGTM